jgi:ABC-type glutathione transport system ATPase component
MTPPALEAQHLKKTFSSRHGAFWRRRTLHHTAIDDVGFELATGRCLGIVGESGSGKTTLVRMLAGLSAPSSGSIRVGGSTFSPASARARRHEVQMVFQDPTESLNPSFTAQRIIADPLLRLRRLSPRELAPRVAELARLVHLPPELLQRYPHQLSGGQKARVGIARAIAAEPRVLLLDEPTTALDVSVQARILLLLDRLRRELGLSLVFISHDLSVVRLLCDDVAILQAGKLVEQGPVQQVFALPVHEYTRTLLAAIPRPSSATSHAA